MVRHVRGQLSYRLHGEGRRRHPAQELRDRVVLADGVAPLHACLAVAARDAEAGLGRAGGRRGDREPARVERDEGQLEALAQPQENVLLGHAHVGEAQQRVLDAVQPHEVAAVRHLDAGPV